MARQDEMVLFTKAFAPIKGLKMTLVTQDEEATGGLPFHFFIFRLYGEKQLM